MSATPAAKPDVEVAFAPRRISVGYRKPLRLFGRLLWHRTVRRTFTLYPYALRELLLFNATLDTLRTKLGRPISDEEAVATLVGIDAIYMPQAALLAIWDAFAELNLQKPTPSGGREVPIGELIRALEREPFSYTREQVLELSAEQIQARLVEAGEEKIAQIKTEAALLRGGGE